MDREMGLLGRRGAEWTGRGAKWTGSGAHWAGRRSLAGRGDRGMPITSERREKWLGTDFIVDKRCTPLAGSQHENVSHPLKAYPFNRSGSLSQCSLVRRASQNFGEKSKKSGRETVEEPASTVCISRFAGLLGTMGLDQQSTP